MTNTDTQFITYFIHHLYLIYYKSGAKVQIICDLRAIFQKKMLILCILNTLLMKKIVVLTGAGMSVESGLKTFRDADGLWEEYPVQQVATHEGWLNDPTLVTNFYNMLRKKCWNVKPNEGHKLVAALEENFDVTVVTQNVDNLHEQAGSKKVIHLHGELMKVCSSNDPDDPRYQQLLTPDNCEIVPGTKAGDGSLLRPFIVFFGEAVPMITAAAAECQEADIFIIIGTSLNVYPAAGLIQYTRPGIPIYLIDPKPVSTGYSKVIQIQKGASEGMKELTKLLVP
jgi:NAD-dependent deacetylase